MALYSLYTHDVVRISGPDAHKLLNDTLTCRFDDALQGTGRWFALLSPQGKVQIDGLVTWADDAYWFDIEAGLVADFIKKMKLYRLRAKVVIEHDQSRGIFWSPAGTAPEGVPYISYRDGRTPTLGTRYLVPWERHTDELRAAPPPLEAYDAPRIEAGVPEFGPDYGADQVFPHDVAMDLLGGVDFKKGCYIGQEVVSRMQHRGTARRRPVIVDDLQTEGLDAPIKVGGRDAGTVGGAVDGKAVAIVRLDRFDGGEVTVGGKLVTVRIPDWATYRLGESAGAE